MKKIASMEMQSLLLAPEEGGWPSPAPPPAQSAGTTHDLGSGGRRRTVITHAEAGTARRHNPLAQPTAQAPEKEGGQPSLTPPPAQLPAPEGMLTAITSAHKKRRLPQGDGKRRWSLQEDALVIERRGSGLKWDEVCTLLPGRSALSCRLRYQNYLERRRWTKEEMNNLARLYKKFVLPPPVLVIRGGGVRAFNADGFPEEGLRCGSRSPN